MSIKIEQARPEQTEIVAGILREAANWLAGRGEKLWDAEQLTAENLREQVAGKMFWLATIDGEAAGCVRYQTEDAEYWSDVPHADSAFIHKLAVKRKFAGRGVSKALINFAKEKAQGEGKTFLRLDCAMRENLQRVYENQGFVFHSVKERNPYPVARYEFRLTEN